MASCTCMTASEWLTYLCTKSEDEILNIIKREPDLVWKKLEFNCLVNIVSFNRVPCNCCEEFESLKSEKPWDIFIQSLQNNIENGHCEHLSSCSGIDNNQSEGTTTVHFVHTYTGLHNKQSEGTAGIHCVHIASALGHKKILKKILPKITYYQYLSHNIAKYRSKLLDLTPLHIAVIHQKLDVFELILKKCKYFIRSSTCHLGTRPVYDIYKGHCLTTAAEYNSVPFLKSMFRHCEQIIPSKYICDALRVALLEHNHQSAELLLGKFASCHLWSVEMMKCADTVFKTGDKELFTILMKYKQLPFARYLSSLIAMDKTEFAEILLKYAKKNKIALEWPCPFTIQAVLHNSLQIVNLLVTHCELDIRKIYKGYNGADWARALGYNSIEVQLRNNGVESNFSILTQYAPLIAIFDFLHVTHDVYKNVEDYNIYGNIRTLIANGADINAELPNGETPFIKAVFNVIGYLKYPIIRTLLLNGAEPFRGNISNSYLLDSYLITEFLYCNVDICINNFETSLFKFMLMNLDKSNNMLMKLLLRYAHTIPQRYKRPVFSYINTLPEGTISGDILSEFDEAFCAPRSLLVLCRNSIRRRFGRKIHEFVEMNLLPLQIRSILILEDVLKEEGMLIDINKKLTVFAAKGL